MSIKKLRPSDLPKAETFDWSESFGMYELEEAAKAILWFCQEKDNWEVFSPNDLLTFCKSKGWEFDLCSLIEFAMYDKIAPLYKEQHITIIGVLVGVENVIYRLTDPQQFAQQILTAYAEKINKIKQE